MNSAMHRSDRSGARERFVGSQSPHRFRRAIVLFVAITIAQHDIPTAIASEQVPTQLAPEDDSIAAAKRGLSTLNSNAKNAAVAPSSGTSPTVSIPEFRAVEPAGIVNPPKPDEKLKAQPSTNWLVDAMMKPKNERSGDRTRDSLRDRLADKSKDPSHAGEREKDGNAETHSEQEPGARRLHEVSNPLGRYMADWLTPQDYALLRKTADATADRQALEFGASLPVGVSSGSDELSSALAGFGIESFTRDKDPAIATKPAENPYLQAWALPDPPVASSLPPPTSPLTAAPSFTPPPAPEPPSSKPTLPDFVKPATDDKYFKPLKRF